MGDAGQLLADWYCSSSHGAGGQLGQGRGEGGGTRPSMPARATGIHIHP